MFDLNIDVPNDFIIEKYWNRIDEWKLIVDCCSKYDSDINEESDSNRTGQGEKKREDPMVELFPDDDHDDNRNNKCKELL